MPKTKREDMCRDAVRCQKEYEALTDQQIIMKALLQIIRHIDYDMADDLNLQYQLQKRAGN